MKPKAWQSVPVSEITRLAKRLQTHLRKAGVSIEERRIPQCLTLTKKVLDEQGWSCAFSGGDSQYCWNGNSEADKEALYIRFRWGHKIPRSTDADSHFSNFYLLCERCNNQIQTSRTLRELTEELNHKIEFIRKLAEQAESELSPQELPTPAVVA